MNFIEKAWYKDSLWLAILKPLALLFCLVSKVRKWRYLKGRKKVYTPGVPLIVVGNINVGGTGKTPLIIYLVRILMEAGYKPGIVSRGYGSKASEYPYSVDASSSPETAGDEAYMLAHNLDCPLVIDPERVKAVQHLEHHFNCDIILSDDGMQHYAMGRHIEIAVIDGLRLFGNKQLLPAGPLREPVARLQEVDFIIRNGEGAKQLSQPHYLMQVKPLGIFNLQSHSRYEYPETDSRPKVHAVAGIGNPERFFSTLCNAGFDIITHIYPDHHDFQLRDISFTDELDVVMTEKDAVKCQQFATNKHWYLQVEAEVEDRFPQALLDKLKQINQQKD